MRWVLAAGVVAGVAVLTRRLLRRETWDCPVCGQPLRRNDYETCPRCHNSLIGKEVPASRQRCHHRLTEGFDESGRGLIPRRCVLDEGHAGSCTTWDYQRKE